MKSGLKIGVLAVQGAFIEHKRMLESLGCECVELRQKSDICDLDGLVLPGGESTVQGKLLRELDMFDELKEKITNGLPVLATCAGLILLASHISNDDNVYFGTLPVTVKRNAYGRQLGSFEATARFDNSFDFSYAYVLLFLFGTVTYEELTIRLRKKQDKYICDFVNTFTLSKEQHECIKMIHKKLGLIRRIRFLLMIKRRRSK